MVNRGEEKVRVHIIVVLRSTMNTSGGTENKHSSINLSAMCETHEKPTGRWPW